MLRQQPCAFATHRSFIAIAAAEVLFRSRAAQRNLAALVSDVDFISPFPAGKFYLVVVQSTKELGYF